jgi:hypothetical protein
MIVKISKEFFVDYSNTVWSILLILVYIAFFVVYIMLIVKLWKACNAVMEINDKFMGISYRDTVRFVAEINKGAITNEDQEEAQEIINQ